MKFVTKDKDYQEQFIVTFPSVDAALSGHRWDEIRLRPKDVKALCELPGNVLREWMLNIYMKAVR